MNTFYVIFLLIVMAFVLIALTYSALGSDSYTENLQLFRKGFYVLLVIGYSFGCILGFIDISDWRRAVELFALFVFIDISVLQTPDISKIWQAEFNQNNTVKKVLTKSREVIDYNSKKVECFTDIIGNTSKHFENKTIPTDLDMYKKELLEYLHQYANTFQLHISLFELESSGNQDLHISNISNAFRKIEQCYNLNIEDAEFRQSFIQSLNEGHAIELKNKKDEDDKLRNGKRKYVISYFGEKYNLLIGVSSSIVDIDGIDSANILNLVRIFDWYMVD